MRLARSLPPAESFDRHRLVTAVIFYAGHGIEMGGISYLVPVDAHVLADRDLQLEGIPVSQALASIECARKLRLLILDACRGNPIAARIVRTAGATRSIGRGLARVEPEWGTLVVYAAKDGQVAQDGNGHHSPFSAALVRSIETPGLELNRLFRRVTADVLKATNRRQAPYTYRSLPEEEFFFKPPRTAELVATSTPADAGKPGTADEPAPSAMPRLGAPPSGSEPSLMTSAVPAKRKRPSVQAIIDPRPAPLLNGVRRITRPNTVARPPKEGSKLARQYAYDRKMTQFGFKRSGQPRNPRFKATNCGPDGACALND